MQQTFTSHPEIAVKTLLLLGVLFAILIMAGGILAIGVAIYGILTMPFMLLVELAVRFFLVALFLYVVGRVVWPLVRYFRREEI